MSFNAPIDPAYTRFLEGLKQLCTNHDSYSKWDAKKEDWFRYDPKVWAMEDFGLADTSPGLAFREEWVFSPPSKKWHFVEIFIPDLFNRVRKVGRSYLQLNPKATLVWVPWGGGDWRSAIYRKPTSQRPPIPKPPDTTTLSPKCIERIMKVQDAERRGFITYDQARRHIDDIISDCT